MTEPEELTPQQELYLALCETSDILEFIVGLNIMDEGAFDLITKAIAHADYAMERADEDPAFSVPSSEGETLN